MLKTVGEIFGGWVGQLQQGNKKRDFCDEPITVQIKELLKQILPLWDRGKIVLMLLITHELVNKHFPEGCDAALATKPIDVGVDRDPIIFNRIFTTARLGQL